MNRPTNKNDTAKGQLLDLDGKVLREQPLSIYLFSTGGYFDMPTPVVWTGHYLLKIGNDTHRIWVNATTHQAAYFKFEE